MRRAVKVLLTIGFLLGSTGALMAATGSSTFTVSASVPAPSGVNIAATSITTGASPVSTPVTGTALAFGTLSFDAVNHIYVPDHFYSIAAGPTAGAGSTSVTLSYTDAANPNGAGHGLGYKATATFVKVVGSTETVLTSHGTAGKKALKDVTSESITSSELGSGIFKVYLGIATGAAGDPTGSEPFTAADTVGAYSGSLVVSATVV